MTTNQMIDGVPRDPCQWTDLQILDFLGVALRNVDLVGTVKLSEIRQGFEYMRAQSGAEQPAPDIKLNVNVSNVKVTVNPDGSYSIDQVAAAQTCCGSCPGGCVYGLKA